MVNRGMGIYRGGGEIYDLRLADHLALRGVEVEFVAGLALHGEPKRPEPSAGTVYVRTPYLSSVLLTLQLGFPGTFVGTVLSHAVVLPAYLRYLCRAFDLPFGAFARQSLLRPYAISAVTAAVAVTLIAPLPGGGLAVLAAKAAAGGAVFVALVWLFGIDGDERRQAGMLLTGMARWMRQIGGPA